MRIFDSDNHEKFSISSIEKRNLKCKNRTRLYVMTDSSRHVRRETADEREQSPLNTEFVVQWLRPIIIDAYLFRTLTHLISFPSGEFCDVCQQKNYFVVFWETWPCDSRKMWPSWLIRDCIALAGDYHSIQDLYKLPWTDWERFFLCPTSCKLDSTTDVDAFIARWPDTHALRLDMVDGVEDGTNFKKAHKLTLQLNMHRTSPVYRCITIAIDKFPF